MSNKIELLAINSDLDSFRQGVAGKGLELRNLNNELGTLNSSKSRYENFITNQDSLKSELIRSREENRALGNAAAVKRIDAGIAQVEKELAKGQKNLKEVNDKLSKREQLLAEQQRAQERKKEIQEDQDKLEPQLDDAEDKLNRARTEAAANKSAHDKDEAKLDEDIKNVMVEGMQDFLAQEITRAEEARQKIIDKEAADAKDKKPTEEQNVDKLFNTRWDRDISNRNFIRKWWNPSNRELATDRIDADYQRLVTSGPDTVVRDMLREANRGRFMPGGSVDAWMTANPEAVQRMRAQMVETLMTKRVQTGKVTESDARYIAGTSWGEGAITKALEKKQEIADQIKELRDKGIIKGNVGEWVKNEIRRNPLFWITILLGSAAIGAIGPALSIAYSSGTGVAGAMAAGLSAKGTAGMAGAAGVGLGVTRYFNRN